MYKLLAKATEIWIQIIHDEGHPENIEKALLEVSLLEHGNILH